jgi:hypothetical protein
MSKNILKKSLQSLYQSGLMPLKVLEEPFFLGNESKKMKSFKNKFKGKRCFIIGNGPSLNLIDVEKLKDEYTFGVNSFFYKTETTGIKPTFYVVEDGHVVDDNIEEINNYDVKYKFFPSVYKSKLKASKNTTFFNMNRGFYEKYSPNCDLPRFSTNCSERVYCGQSVTIINLQLAFYMGFTEVYLIGMDFSYHIPDSAEINGESITSTEDDCNHFDPRYFGKGKKWHDPKLENVLVSYKLSKLVYEHFGRKIVNATVGGKLDVFDREDFNTLFNK